MERLTAKQRVLAHLRLARELGAEVPMHTLTNPSIGGTEGLRRLRELRAEGYPIIGPRRRGKAATRWYSIGPE